MQPDQPGAPRGAYAELTVPLRLIIDLQDSPLGIGIYSMIVRQFVISKTPIALSAADILHYDPTLRRGAILRAFRRLLSGGWLIEYNEAGHKTRYAPTWGRLHGNPHPWTIGLPLLGRPRRMIVVRIGQQLLDICLGKITPHTTRNALIERYLSQPLLSLTDVGAYVLTLAGYPTVTSALLQLGLVRQEQAQSLPSAQHFLALASQQVLYRDDAPKLNDRGLRRAGYSTEVLHIQNVAHKQVLFFVPKQVIGSMIDSSISPLIGQEPYAHPSLSAVEPHGDSSLPTTERSHGLQELEQRNEHTPLPPSNWGGGSNNENCNNHGIMHQHLQNNAAVPTQKTKESHQQNQQDSISVTPTAQALHAINVLPAQIAELSVLPIATVQAAIRDGQTRDGIRDLAGWVVHLLRNTRDHGWTIRSPQRADAPDVLRAAFAAYAVEQRDTYPYSTERLDHDQDKDNDVSLPDLSVHEREGQPTPIRQVGTLWATIQATLRMQLPRAEFDTWIKNTQLQSLEHEIACIVVCDARSKAAVESRYIRVIRDALHEHLDRTMQVRVIIQGAARASVIHHDRTHVFDQDDAQRISSLTVVDCPAWIAPTQWMALPRMLRAALIQSTVVQGLLCARTEFLTNLIQTRYPSEMQMLLDAQGDAV